jgi:hypothetical protein
VEKHSGRHRKRRQGWAEQVRWVLGAVLAAVFCSPTGRSAKPVAEVRQPLPARRPHEGREPGQGRPVSAARVKVPQPRVGEAHTGTHPAGLPRRRELYTGRRGWCEDDDGVRGVRPYLARHENHVVRAHTRGSAHAPRGREAVGGHGSAAAASASVSGGGEGEFAELARLVRRWQAIAT